MADERAGEAASAFGGDHGTVRTGRRGVIAILRGGTSVRTSWLLFLGLPAVLVVVDQASKAWIVATFEVGVPVAILGDFVRISLIHNTGALFGLFRGQAILFGAVSILVVATIVWYHGRQAGSSLILSVALGLLLAGAIGNLIDRLRLEYVIDFVDMGIGAWRWYTFNVADAAISTSLVLLIAAMVLRPVGPAGDVAA